jgi:hypothetical protein
MRRISPILYTALAAACSSSTAADSTPNNAAADAFVGTWARAGTVTTVCPGQSPTDTAFTGTLGIALGSATGSIVGTDSVNGCVADYTASGSVATARSGQTCTFTNARGGQSTLTNDTHTLTLSADGKTIAEASTGGVVIESPDGGKTTTCTSSSSGTFTKQ